MAETATGLLDATGRPMRQAVTKDCPVCHGTKRVASAGFGEPHPVCATCGYDFFDEAWTGGDDGVR